MITGITCKNYLIIPIIYPGDCDTKLNPIRLFLESENLLRQTDKRIESLSNKGSAYFDKTFGNGLPKGFTTVNRSAYPTLINTTFENT